MEKQRTTTAPKSEPSADRPAEARAIEGWLVVGAGMFLLLFLALGADVKGHGMAWRADHESAKWIHHHVNHFTEVVASAITTFGSIKVLAPVVAATLAALALTRRWMLFVGFGVAALGSVALGTALKMLYLRARPATETFYAPRFGYSFPSGHTLGACIVYLMLAYVVAVGAPRFALWIWPAMAALVASVAASLLLIGVHYLSDVLGAVCIGLSWLMLLWAALSAAASRDAL